MGWSFCRAVKRQNAALPVVVMTAFGSVETAVEAMKAGASDYVLKPFSLAEMRMVIHKELDVRNLREENRTLREALGKTLFASEYCGAQPEDAGGAGDRGAGGADECDRAAGRRERRGQRSDRARDP